MKKARGVLQFSTDNRPIQNKIAAFVVRKGLVTVDGYYYYPILDEKTNEEAGRFVPIKGNPIVVRVVEWLTDYHGPNAKTWRPRRNKDGEIVDWY